MEMENNQNQSMCSSMNTSVSVSNISICDTSGRDMGLGRKSASPYMDHLMSTPVTSIKRFKRNDERVNPFERQLLNRLHEPLWSPSVLNCTSDTSSSMETPPTSGWEIDHIAKLNPISIEESPSTHQNETVLDPRSEAEVQATISRFFCTNELIAPSPISHAKQKDSNTKGVNTDLSFPSYLPPEFEQFLHSFSNSASASTSNGSKNYSCYAETRNIFNCVDIEIEGEENSNSTSNSGSQHPPTPNPELNTSVTRRKLDFTFEKDGNEDEGGRHAVATTDEESEDDHYPISSVVLDFERSNGRTINSPEDTSKAGGIGIRAAAAANVSPSTSGYVSIRRSSSSQQASPIPMETSFSTSTFIRSSCEEELMSAMNDEQTAATHRLRIMLQSPGTTPIRMK